MTDDELNALIDMELAQTIGDNSTDSEHQSDIARAFDYYMGRPFGNEVQGQSQVVSTDVRDTMETVLPLLLEPFVSGDIIAEYQPVTRADEQAAKQATDYINYIFTKDNNGFLVLYTWFKDALLQRTGVVFPHWCEKEITITDEYQGLDRQQLEIMAADETVEIIGLEEYQVMNADPATQPSPDVNDTQGVMQPGVLYNVRIRRTDKYGTIEVLNIAPENYFISRGAVSVDDATISGFRMLKSISDLRAQGVSEDILDGLQSATEPFTDNEVSTSRWRDEDGQVNVSYDSSDNAARRVWVTVCFVRVDYDGDGYAELRMIQRAGSDQKGGTIISNDEVDGNDLCTLTPVIIPHKHHGLSYADLVMDVQLEKSVIKRQILNNFYQLNNTRKLVDRNKNVDIDALLNNVPGSYIMADGTDAVKELEAGSLPQAAFDLLEYEDQTRETRSGVMRFNPQGLDSNSLSKTATGANIVASGTQQRAKMTARIFAETGVIKLFRSMLKLVIKHQDRERTLRLRDEWVNFDPRGWNAAMDVTIAVALGAGTKQEQAQFALNLFNLQKEVFPLGGADWERVYNNLSKFVENAGWKSPEMYFVPPQEVKPQPDPAVAQKEAHEREIAAKQQADAQKMQFESDNAEKDRMMKGAIEKDKIDSNERIRMAEIAARQEESFRMAEMNAKPTTQVQFDAGEAMGQVAQNLQAMAATQMQGQEASLQAINVGVQAMTQAAQAIAMAVAQMNGPKKATLPSGKTAIIEPINQ